MNTILDSTLDGLEWSASSSCRFTPAEPFLTLSGVEPQPCIPQPIAIPTELSRAAAWFCCHQTRHVGGAVWQSHAVSLPPAVWLLSIQFYPESALVFRFVLIIKSFAVAGNGSSVHTSLSQAVQNGDVKSTAVRHELFQQTGCEILIEVDCDFLFSEYNVYPFLYVPCEDCI